MNGASLLRLSVKSALGITAAVGVTGLLASQAFAQSQTNTANSGKTNNKASQVTHLSKILVTGSHIPRTEIAQANPVITINRDKLLATGYNTLGEVLQHLPSMGPMTLAQTSSTGNTYVNLHYLGAKRTLVLVNGQRWTTSISGGVDLVSIPVAVIQRIEVLMDGASAIYGSDAIAGVINVITVKNFRGARASAYYGMYDAHGDGGGWDGKTQQYSFTLGTGSKRASVMFSAGYYKQDPIFTNQRTLTSGPPSAFGESVLKGNESSNTLGGNLVLYTPSGVPSMPGCSATGAYGNPGCHTNGPFIGPNANPQPYSTLDNFNRRSQDYTLTNYLERWHLYSQGHYDLTSQVTFHYMATYQRTNEWAMYGPGEPVSIGTYESKAANGLRVGVSATNPYNPFGVDLVPYFSGSPGFSAWCGKYGTGPNHTCSSNYDVLLSYQFIPTGPNGKAVMPYQWFHQRRTYYLNGGFTGYFQLDNNQWQWSANYIYAETLNPFSETGWVDTPNLQQLQEMLGPTSDCARTTTCTPIDIFGGGLTSQMVHDLNPTLYDVEDTVMRDYNGNLGGDFFNSWYAGPWGGAVGYEYEELNGYSTPDPLAERSLAYTATSGRENTDAEYIELRVPLAENLPGARSASIDVAERWSQFKWNGVGATVASVVNGNVAGSPISQSAHAATPRIAIKWQPIQSLLLRGTWSQGFRIPSISELFDGVAVQDQGAYVQDPCADNLGPTVGCPTGVPSSSYVQIDPIQGGNVNLKPEKAVSRSVGFVYSPTWAPGLNVNADFFKTELNTQVTTLSLSYYLDACYYGGDPSACQHIIRNANGSLSNVIDLRTNSGSYKVEGWDIGIHYQFPATPVGYFKMGAEASLPREAVACNPTFINGQQSSYCENGVGSSGIVNRYDVWLDWQYGPWEASWTADIIGPQWEICSGSYYLYGKVPLNEWCSKPDAVGNPANGTAVGLNRLGTTVYNDLYASYTLDSWNTTFAIGINNVFDKAPPACTTCYMNYQQNLYRIPGRFFYGRVSVRF